MERSKKRSLTDMLSYKSFFMIYKKLPVLAFVNILLVVVIFFLVFHISDQLSFLNIFAQQTEKNPAFQDSYWTDKTVAAGADANKLEEKEVGPGEGTSTLAIVLVNKAQSDISAIKGYLSLPSNFESTGTGGPATHSPINETSSSNFSNTTFNNSTPSTNSISLGSSFNVAEASYDSIVKPGEEFTLYFDINIQKNVDLGEYKTTMDLVYSKVLTTGDIVIEDIPIFFRIPGKVIFDVATKNQYLSPAKFNKVGLDIINKGSADADGVIISITNPNNNINNLAAVSMSSENNTESLSAGNVSNNNSSSNTFNSNDQTVQDNQKDTTSMLSTFGTQKFNIGKIPAGKSITIQPVIYPSIVAAETLQHLNVEISYSNPIGNRQIDEFSIGLIINAQPTDSNFEIDFDTKTFNENQNGDPTENGLQSYANNYSKSNMVTAGNMEDLTFQIQKTTMGDVKDVVISISPSSESVQILGTTRWSAEVFDKDTISLNTTIFVSEELIGQPIQLNIQIDYLLDGTLKSESLDLGLYVNGKIDIRAYDFQVNVIGDEPNLVSNLLNEGNTDALFTTAQMIPSNSILSSQNVKNSSPPLPSLVSEYPPVQYLGDLAENSPLPISIPLKISNNTDPGLYPVFIKISYKDNLRNDNQIVVNGTVEYRPELEDNDNNSVMIFDSPVFFILIIIAILVIVLLYLLYRRKKTRNKNKRNTKFQKDSSNFSDDLDSILGDK